MFRFYIDGLLLPVTPSKIETKIKNTNKKFSLLQYDINLLKAAGLTQIKFETFLPMTRYPFAVYDNGFEQAQFYLSKLEQLKVSMKPFTFIVSKLLPNGDFVPGTNMQVSLEDYTIIEDNKKYGGDIGVKISLKQYRHFGTKVLTMSADGLSATVVKTRSAKQIDEYYVVKEGETVYDIAKRETGDGENYLNIMTLNNLDSIYDIEVGQVIKLG